MSDQPKRWRCPHCGCPLGSAQDTCSGSAGEQDHPSELASIEVRTARLQVTLTYEYEVTPFDFGDAADDPTRMALIDIETDPTIILNADWKIKQAVLR